MVRKLKCAEVQFFRRHQGIYRAIKRCLDLCLGSVALLAVLPVLPLLALIIKFDSRGPVFFQQLRLGLNGQPFRILKLRTMVHLAPEIRSADGSQFVGKHDPRVTRSGRWLRDWSLDELPQLVNVIKGDMSIVGPRPDAPGAVNLDTPHLRTKRQVRPGLTSLASVRGRNAIPWASRVRWEVCYVKNPSFILDFYILLRTVAVVVRREGVCDPVREPAMES